MPKLPVGLHDTLREILPKRRLIATKLGRGTS